ncbi:MAG: molybdopterin-binding protein [Clostridia bacterium]|nr:molybdopterin-binding protein [Clostridia bacterium]MDY5553966.1 molybdopterin-binding protein [Blautia sp.]
MKEIRTEDAVGQVLCHDITQIIKDVKKGVLFKKGHIIREEDIPLLLSAGKEHLYVWEKKEGILHENEGAEILYKICAGDSDTIHGTEIKEGKIELIANIDGVLKIRRDALLAVNSLGEMMIASRHGDFPVKKGDKIAGTRIIPLVIEKEKMDRAQEAAGKEPIFSILPYRKKKVGIVTTGSEVKKGLIQDTFTPVLINKFASYPSEILGQTEPGDDMEQITADILKFIEDGADVVVCSGGMSVDPDDRTPGAIKAAGVRIVSYGAPVLPGAMMLVSYYEKDNRRIPVLGLPGCVMYAKNTVFDLMLPRIMADDEIYASEIAALGEGGLCLGCETCTFPNCGFGKG